MTPSLSARCYPPTQSRQSLTVLGSDPCQTQPRTWEGAEVSIGMTAEQRVTRRGWLYLLAAAWMATNAIVRLAGNTLEALPVSIREPSFALGIDLAWLLRLVAFVELLGATVIAVCPAIRRQVAIAILSLYCLSMGADLLFVRVSRDGLSTGLAGWQRIALLTSIGILVCITLTEWRARRAPELTT